MESVNHRQNIGFRIKKTLAHTLCGSVNAPILRGETDFHCEFLAGAHSLKFGPERLVDNFPSGALTNSAISGESAWSGVVCRVGRTREMPADLLVLFFRNRKTS